MRAVQKRPHFPCRLKATVPHSGGRVPANSGRVVTFGGVVAVPSEIAESMGAPTLDEFATGRSATSSAETSDCCVVAGSSETGLELPRLPAPLGRAGRNFGGVEALFARRHNWRVGVHGRVCGLRRAPYGGSGGPWRKARAQEHRAMKRVAGLADKPCATGGEEWRIRICGSLLLGSRRKGS